MIGGIGRLGVVKSGGGKWKPPAGAYGVRINTSMPPNAEAGMAERLGTLASYNDHLGALTWTEVDEPMPEYVAEIKNLLVIQKQMKRCVVSDNLSVKRYLGAEDSSVYENGDDYEEGDGNVLVEMPKFWVRIIEDGDWMEYWISPTPEAGMDLHPAFAKNGMEVDYRYPAAFEGVLKRGGQCLDRYDWESGGLEDRLVTQFNVYSTGDKLASVPGYIPTSSANIAQFRAACRNIDGNSDDSSWRQMDGYLWHAVQLLFIVEYASTNTAKRLTGSDVGGLVNLDGNRWQMIVTGNTTDQYYPIVPTGLTQRLGNRSGCVGLSSEYEVLVPKANEIGPLPGAPEGWTAASGKYTHEAGSKEALEFGLVPAVGVKYRVKLQYVESGGEKAEVTFGGETLSVVSGQHNVFYVTAGKANPLRVEPASSWAGYVAAVSIISEGGTKWGDVVPSYRGIENIYGHIWEWRDGLLLDFKKVDSVDIYAADGGFSNSIGNYDLIAESLSAPASGYIKRFAGRVIKRLFYPEETGSPASLVIGVSDRYYNTGAAGLRVVAVGGSATYGGFAGAFCVYANYGVTNTTASYGGRLCL